MTLLASLWRTGPGCRGYIAVPKDTPKTPGPAPKGRAVSPSRAKGGWGDLGAGQCALVAGTHTCAAEARRGGWHRAVSRSGAEELWKWNMEDLGGCGGCFLFWMAATYIITLGGGPRRWMGNRGEGGGAIGEGNAVRYLGHATPSVTVSSGGAGRCSCTCVFAEEHHGLQH